MDQYPFLAYFRVSCPCGENEVFVLGYPVKDEGPRAQTVLLGPLAIECPKCNKISELMDPRKDGYDGEIGCNCNMTGEGARSRFPCPKCGVSPMLVMPGFSYQHDDMEEWSEEIGQRPQDFFGAFWLYGGCMRCRGVVSITGFECA
jgi:hypothetical protein